MQAIDENGDTLNGFTKSDRFENDGWTVALFNGLEDQFLGPNESRTIEIGFQAPEQYSGSINVRFFVFALGAYERTYSIDVGGGGAAAFRTETSTSSKYLTNATKIIHRGKRTDRKTIEIK